MSGAVRLAPVVVLSCVCAASGACGGGGNGASGDAGTSDGGVDAGVEASGSPDGASPDGGSTGDTGAPPPHDAGPPAMVAACSTLKTLPVRTPTYYVDFGAGSDAADGKSQATAWKHAPGDTNATGNAQSTTLVPGDVVLLKGGVVYEGTITVTASGTSSSAHRARGRPAARLGLGHGHRSTARTCAGARRRRAGRLVRRRRGLRGPELRQDPELDGHRRRRRRRRHGRRQRAPRHLLRDQPRPGHDDLGAADRATASPSTTRRARTSTRTPCATAATRASRSPPTPASVDRRQDGVQRGDEHELGHRRALGRQRSPARTSRASPSRTTTSTTSITTSPASAWHRDGIFVFASPRRRHRSRSTTSRSPTTTSRTRCRRTSARRRGSTSSSCARTSTSTTTSSTRRARTSASGCWVTASRCRATTSSRTTSSRTPTAWAAPACTSCSRAAPRS